MVLNLSGFVTPTGIRKNSKRRPLLNQVPRNITSSASVGISSMLIQKRNFWNWFRARPELNAPVSIRVDDTIGEVEFTSIDGTPLGRNKLMEARKFWNENQLYERLKSVQFDRLVTGSGFLWLGKFNDKQRKEIMKRVLPDFYFKDIENKILIKAMDEDLRRTRIVDYIASATVEIQHDLHEVLAYVQHYSAMTEVFSPDEVIHIPLHRTDGKVDGFSPVWSLDYEIILLWAIKENMLAYIRNGGSPNKAWILPEELSNSENHKWLVEELMNRGTLENRHGNLVLTGKVEVQDLEPSIKDMEYKELALWLTSNIAYALRVPVTRIPYLIGSAASGTDSGGMAESGYWAMVDSDQRTLEMHLNSQLFNKLGYSIRFKRQYRIDDIREAQAMNFTMDSVGKMRNELMSAGLKLKDQKLVSLLSGNERTISMSEVEELTDKDRENMIGPMSNNNPMSDSETADSPAKTQKNDTKRTAAKNNPSSSNQTGY